MEILIVGTGYVGLVTGACFANAGNTVHCVDTNPAIVETLQSGHTPIYEPQLEALLQENIQEKRLHFTTDIERVINKVECIFICVGTPTKEDGSCDTTYVETVARSIGVFLEKDIIVVTKSTVPVGTTDIICDIIQKEMQKRSCTYTVHCVSNPEFLKEGSAVQDFLKPDRIIIGTEEEYCKVFFEELYAPFSRNKNKIIFMSIRSAEMTKYTANAMLATKISFINEIALLCEQNGADISAVRTGIGSDMRIGYHFIYPGIGYGGSCFPKDVQALIAQGKEHGLDMNILEAVEAVNKTQKKVLVDKMQQYYSISGGLKGKTIALWGLSFKPNTDDIREAPASIIIEELLALGASVQAYDPIAISTMKKFFGERAGLTFVDDMYEVLECADMLCIATEWSIFSQPDFAKMKKVLKNPIIFDGRNIYSADTVSKKGFTYISIGRKCE